MAHQAGSAADLERLMEEYGTGLLRLCALQLGDAALAEDVKEIFTEIYNDPERFPIHDVGGYAWRGDSATGEHNCGTDSVLSNLVCQNFGFSIRKVLYYVRQ